MRWRSRNGFDCIEPELSVRLGWSQLIHFQFCDPECLDMELNGRRNIRDSLGSRFAIANDHPSKTHRVRDETIRVLFHNDLHIFGHFCLDIETVCWCMIAHIEKS